MASSSQGKTGSFRGRLDFLVPRKSVGSDRHWVHARASRRDAKHLDPRRDPAHHNRVLAAAAQN